MNRMQQQQQAQQTMNSHPPTPLHLVTTEQIQKYLDDNKNLIMAILESQKMGKVAEIAQYQAMLQHNLTYLAAIADAQPEGSATKPSQIKPQGVLRLSPQISPILLSIIPPLSYTRDFSQLPTSSVAPQGNSHMLQPQASTMQPQPGAPVAKLPFQLNALRPQDQQNQMLQFQQQQQLQGHFSLGGGPNAGLHFLMQPGLGNSSGLMDLRGSQSGGLEGGSGNGQGNSGLGPMEGRE